MASLTTIEGIGETYMIKLKEAGIGNTDALLDKCGQKKDRTELAKNSGISEKLILAWANKADLSRVKGVSTQYADLLEAAGVDTVPELAGRNAENLTVKMKECNDDKNLVRQVPSEKQVIDWIEQAKTLPRALHY